MLKLIQRFAASQFSGYMFIALAVALAGAGYWFWSELKEFGGLEQRAETQARTIAAQQARIERITRMTEQRQAALADQVALTQKLERNERMYRLAVQEARTNANKALKQCLDMGVASGMSIGPSREPRDTDG